MSVTATTTETTTTTAAPTKCARLGCAHAADGQPWIMGMSICWLCRLVFAGRGAR